jgi:hypothetical protein
MFPALTVHQGLDNQSEKLLRLSLYFRYQPMSHPIRWDSMFPHDGLTWDEHYRTWAVDDPVKYYWKNWKMNLLPRQR